MSATPTLDDAITALMASLAVLLVFVIGFYTTVLAMVGRATEKDLPQEPRPARKHVDWLARVVWVAVAFVGFALASLALLVPLTVETIANWQWSVDGRLPTDRGLLILIDLSIAILCIVGTREVVIARVKKRDDTATARGLFGDKW